MTPEERAEFEDLRDTVGMLVAEVFGEPEPESLGLGEARRRLLAKGKAQDAHAASVTTRCRALSGHSGEEQ